MPNIFVLSPKNILSIQSPIVMNGFSSLAIKGSQPSKLGQFKTCLSFFLKKIIISFWVSQIMNQVFRVKLNSREKSYALPRKKKRILSI